jgi:hypothetical protein
MRIMSAPRRVGILNSLMFVAALTWPCLAYAGPPWGTDDASFQATYLQPSDLANPSDLSGDWARAGCEPDAAPLGCTHFGKKLWTAKDTSVAVWQIHDLRWIFPDASAAERYLQQSLEQLSEGLPEVATPPAVGSNTKMFTAQGDAYGLGIEVYMYNLVFRVDNVVVKVFVAQGPTAPKKILTPLMVAALGQKAVERIRAAEPRGVAAAPVPVSQPVPQPQPQPIEPAPVVESTPAPAMVEPEPAPPPKRSRRPSGRLADDVRSYWRSGVDKPYIFVGGDYSKALGSYTLEGGRRLSEKNAFDIAFGFLLHPRIYFQMMFHREVWQVPKVEEVLVRRLEFIYGLDLLALPPHWRIRPALMGLLGLGLGFGRTDALGGTPDPNLPMPVPAPEVREVRGIGIGAVFGGEFALHIRLTRKLELAPYAGITAPAYTYSNDFPAAERHIDGERGFGRAWRWHAGLKIGFGGSG